jgi:hypothetical protein
VHGELVFVIVTVVPREPIQAAAAPGWNGAKAVAKELHKGEDCSRYEKPLYASYCGSEFARTQT